jgi:hypothetical protein
MVGTDMCLSRSSMCCLCCLSFSLIARSLFVPSALFLQLLLSAHPFFRDHCERGRDCGFWKQFVYVLGLLFLADVKLLGGGLALGEGITSQLISIYYNFAPSSSLSKSHSPSSRAGRPRRTRSGGAIGHAAGRKGKVAGCGDRARALDD